MTAWPPRAAPPVKHGVAAPGSELHPWGARCRTGPTIQASATRGQSKTRGGGRLRRLSGAPSASAQGGPCRERAEAAARAVTSPAVTPPPHDSGQTKLKESETAERTVLAGGQPPRCPRCPSLAPPHRPLHLQPPRALRTTLTSPPALRASPPPHTPCKPCA